MPEDPDPYLVPKPDPNRDALADPRVKTFLDTIGKSEGADYNTLVGGRKIKDLSRHPNVVGLRTSAGPSTAFGKYQIVGTTDRSKLRKYANLDYSPENQDLRAVELLRQTGALNEILNDRPDRAVKLAAKEWASIPGSPLPGRKSNAFASPPEPQDPFLVPKTPEPEVADDPFLVPKAVAQFPSPQAAPVRAPRPQPVDLPQGGRFGAGAVVAPKRIPVRRPLPPQKSWGDVKRDDYAPDITSRQDLERSTYESQRGTPSNNPRNIDPRLIKGEQPLDRIGYSREMDAQYRLSRMQDESYRERQAREKKDAEWRKNNQAEIDRQTELYRQDIKNARKVGGDVNQWIAEFGSKAGAGLLEFGGGLTGSDTLKIRSEAALKAAQEEGANRSALSKTAQDVSAGFIANAPELAAMSLGAPPVAAFAGGGAIRAGAHTSDPMAIAQAAGHSGLTGLAFETPGVGEGIKNVLTKAGGVGATTAGLELAQGATPREALTSGLTNALMVGLPEGAKLRRGDVKAGEATRTREAQPVSEVSPARTEAPPQRSQDVAATSTPSVEGKRLYHKDWGEVVELPDQSGARKGRLKVAEVNNPEAIHYPKKVDLSGKGNQRLVPIKEVPAETLPVEPQASPETAKQAAQLTQETTASPQQVIEAQGLKYVGPQELKKGGPVGHMFDVPDGSTLMVKGEVTPEAVQAKLAEHAAQVAKFEPKAKAAAAGNEAQTPLPEGEKSRVLDTQRAELRDSQLPDVSRDTASVVPVDVSSGVRADLQRPAEVAPSGRPSGSQREIYEGGAKSRNDAAAAQPDLSTKGEAETTRGEQTKNVQTAAVGGNETPIQSRGVGEPAPPSTEPKPERSTTAAKNASMADAREKFDLPPLDRPVRRKDVEVFAEARRKHEADPTEAGRIAQKVIDGKHTLTDLDTAQIDVRAQEIQSKHNQVMKEIAAATDPDVIAAKGADADALKAEFDKLSEATDTGGSELARAMRIRRRTINENYEILPMLARAKKAKGRELKPEERARIEKMATEIETLTAKLTEAQEKVKTQELQKEINKVIRKGRRAETKAALDDEFAALKAQFAKAKMETRSGVHSAGLAGLDPEGVLTPLVARMARNRIKAGVVKAEDVVDQVYSALSEHLEGWSKRDVRDAISGYGLEPKGDKRSPEVQQLAQIRSELKKLSSAEDIAAGKKLPPRDKARQTVLLKQEAELQRRLGALDFSPTAQKEPIPYTRETYALHKRVQEIKSTYEKELYRATRGVGGKVVDTVAGVGNVPKTMLSMGDVSALLRQGGYGAFTHPILSSKAAVDMVKSISERGWANVEQEIKNHPRFEEAKRMGVEFTGIDKNDPRLSRREEGYLGADFIDTIAKGKFNYPLKALKGMKDVSERTFVSFLDSQRIRMFDQQADAIKSMKLTPEQARDATKYIASQINDATGRGDLGKMGNQAAPLLNMAMFSPRLLASRVRLLNKMFSPVEWARMPRGARKLVMIDNAKFLGFTALTLGLAKAAGLGVNLDPDDSEFLKIKAGNTRYDTLTGLQQPMRFMIRMAKAVKGGETYAGESKGDIVMDFARSKASPGGGLLWDYLEGKNRLSGKQFEAGKDTLGTVIPLPMQDFAAAIKEDGYLRGIVETLPSLAGVGVQTYKGGAEKATTHAEKLARKFIRQHMPDEAKTQEELDKSRKLSELRLRSRQGEDVKAELIKLRATEKQIKSIEESKGVTRLEEDFGRLGIKEALTVYSVMTRGEKELVKPILTDKANRLVEKLKDEDRPEIERKLKSIGMSVVQARPERPKRVERAERPKRASGQGYAFQ